MDSANSRMAYPNPFKAGTQAYLDMPALCQYVMLAQYLNPVLWAWLDFGKLYYILKQIYHTKLSESCSELMHGKTWHLRHVVSSVEILIFEKYIQ